LFQHFPAGGKVRLYEYILPLLQVCHHTVTRKSESRFISHLTYFLYITMEQERKNYKNVKHQQKKMMSLLII